MTHSFPTRRSSDLSTEAIPFDRSIAVRTFLRPLSKHQEDPNVTEIAIVRAGELYTRTRGAWQLHERSEEHTSELQSLMRISYAVFCLKKKTKTQNTTPNHVS